MKRFALLPLLFLSMSHACFAQAEAAARQQIEAAEAAVGKAIGMKDVATLQRLWSPRMLVNSPANNVLTRDQVIAALGKDQLRYSKYEGSVETFTTFGPDLAVLMGHETLVRADGAYSGRPLYRRYTDVWQRTDGNWVQIVRQATYTSEPVIPVGGSAKDVK